MTRSERPTPLLSALGRSLDRLSSDYAADLAATRLDEPGAARPETFDRFLAEMVEVKGVDAADGDADQAAGLHALANRLGPIVLTIVSRWPADLAEEAAAWELALSGLRIEAGRPAPSQWLDRRR